MKVKMRARTRSRKGVSYLRSKTTVTNSEKKIRQKIRRGDMTFLTGVQADSDYNDDDDDGNVDMKSDSRTKLSKMHRAGGKAPRLKRYNGRGRKETTSAVRGAQRRTAMRSKSHTPLRQRHRCTAVSRRTMSSSSSLTSLPQYSSRPVATSSTFLTSLDDDLTPKRSMERAQSKLRPGIRSRNISSRSMERKQQSKHLNRPVKSAPIPRRNRLRVSADSRRLRMAWMEKPVLNKNIAKYSISDGQTSASDRGRTANFRLEGQRKRRSRNAISAKLRKSTQRLAKLSFSVRRQRELSNSSSITSRTTNTTRIKYQSPMGNRAKQSDQPMPIGVSMCSPPSPTLEQMAVKHSPGIYEDGASTFTSTFLTSTFDLSDSTEPVLPVCDTATSEMLPTIGVRQGKRTRKTHNIVRQLGPAF